MPFDGMNEAGNHPEEMSWRYQKISDRLAAVQGKLTVPEALKLLSQVAQMNAGGASTQWSVVYGISTGEVSVVVGQQYDKILSFSLAGRR